MLTLVLGGARSGKSRFAQSICPGQRVAFLATARADDEEMRSRIERHQRSRPAVWLTVEEPLALTEGVRRALSCADSILIDCLTVWLSNLMWEQRERTPEDTERRALSQIEELAGVAAGHEIIAVSNEVGGGLVPDTEVGRRFRDLQGIVNQRCAALANRVFLTVAGIPIRIKPREEASWPDLL
jgi:adenosylcobinamide kinase/adenosylcobinamide-phosphate guanylyltransferase